MSARPAAPAWALRREHTIELRAAPGAIAPLLTPEGERLWVPGWDPEPVTPAARVPAVGGVFVTGSGAERTFWTVVGVTDRELRYARVTPGSRVGVVDVALTPEGGDPEVTSVRVRYSYVALGPQGERALAELSEERFAAAIEGWRAPLQRLLDGGDPAGGPQ